MKVFSTTRENVEGSPKQRPGRRPDGPPVGADSGPLLTLVRLHT